MSWRTWFRHVFATMGDQAAPPDPCGGWEPGSHAAQGDHDIELAMQSRRPRTFRQARQQAEAQERAMACHGWRALPPDTWPRAGRALEPPPLA
jgi:hypothetical protein